MTEPDMQKAGPAFVVETLKKRSDFLKAAKAKRQHTQGFVLQARKRSTDEDQSGLIRVGYTCSKKVGNAVARNRAKRRLREIAREVIPKQGQKNHDYVLIGRHSETASLEFSKLVDDLARALAVMHPK